MIASTHAETPVQAGALVQRALAPCVRFIAAKGTKRTVILRHPNGSRLTAHLWRVRQVAGVQP